MIAESDDQGNVLREYIYLGNYRIAMATVSLDNPAVIPDASNGNRVSQPLDLYFIHNDHLGTAQKVTDGEQRVVWSSEQTPFGEVTLMTESIRMPMRFPGQYADLESGFSYNYFRDYDPSLGRYIQTDLIGLRGGFGSYVYVLDNPVSANDQYGLVTFNIGVNATFVLINPGVVSGGGSYVAITLNGIEIGGYTQLGEPDGLDIDHSATIGITFDSKDFEGESSSLGFDFGPLSININSNPDTGEPIGIELGFGPGAGVSTSESITSIVPIADIPFCEE